MKSLGIFGLLFVATFVAIAACTAEEVDAEIRTSIQATLNRHADFCKSVGHQDASSIYDFQEATAEVLRRSRYELAETQHQFLTMALRSCFADKTDRFSWNGGKLTASRIRMLDDGRRAEVSVRFHSKNWTHLGVFWLCNKDESWLIYDFCFMLDGVSLCEAKALEMATVLCGDTEMSEALQGLLNSINKRRQGHRGGRVLQKRFGHRFPIHTEPVRWRTEALIELERETRIDRIVEYTDKFVALDPDHPLADHVMALRYNRLDQPELALQYAQRSLNQFGPQEETLLIKAQALRGLEKIDEAIDVHKAALRAFPKDEDHLFHLVKTLPESRANEILPFFDAEYSAASSFRSLVDLCVELKRPKTLAVLMQEFRKLKSEQTPNMTKYYEGVLLGLKGENAKAAAMMKSFLESLAPTVRDEYWHCIAGYYNQLIASGNVVSEYEQADRPFDFAEELLTYETDSHDPVHGRTIEELIDVFTKDNPDNPHAYELAGDYFYNHDEYKKADDAYATSMRLEPEGDTWQMRVWVNPKLNEHDAFLEEIRDQDKIVEYWFGILLYEKKFDAMAECLELYESGEHNESVLTKARAELAFEQGDFNEVIAQISSLDKSDADAEAWNLLARAFVKTKDYNRALYFTKYASEFEGAVCRALVYALQGDLERFEKTIDEVVEYQKHFRKQLVNDENFPDGFAGIAKESKFKQRRMVMLTKEPLALTIQDVDAAIQKVWGMRLAKMKFSELKDNDSDFITKLHGDRFLIDAKGFRFFVQSNPHPFLHGKQGYIDDLKPMRAEKLQRQTPDKAKRLKEKQRATANHTATVGADVTSWPKSKSRLGGTQPTNAPRAAEKMVTGLVAELAGDKATCLLNVDKMRFRPWTDELFKKLTSRKPKR